MNIPRTADTMSDAISLSSPNGRMSNRSREAAIKQLSESLWGPGGATKEDIMGRGPAQPTEAESLRRHAKNLRDLASRGMSVRKFTKEALRAEQRADALEGETRHE